MDINALYATSAGDATARPFSDMQGKLDGNLLKGLDQLGFQ
jgi:ATP-dependent RNA helicase MSS116